jgi:hypothetical protein
MERPMNACSLLSIRSAAWTQAALLFCLGCLWQASLSADEPSDPVNLPDEIIIQRIEPDRRGGQAYRLTYRVMVPIDVFWRFKTDFDNEFLIQNPHIIEHRFVSWFGKTVVTEGRYTNQPDVTFRWQTTLHSDDHRLDFILLNPQECGQRFNYGHIRLEVEGPGTRVTQTGYFDFLGAGLWAIYPWSGGMRSLLRETVRWEQQIVQQLRERYEKEPETGAPP